MGREIVRRTIRTEIKYLLTNTGTAELKEFLESVFLDILKIFPAKEPSPELSHPATSTGSLSSLSCSSDVLDDQPND
ncbi:hypothetical protein HA402_002538 [Bradysia odoriphaga]|nr:hypothetical protein HA402_002538 [Bradysia odoriphaga]